MKSHLKAFGHPVHPMLIVFPLGLLVTSVVFDALAKLKGEGAPDRAADYARTAHKLIGAGVLSGVVAAASGLVDWAAIPAGTRAKRVGTWHGAGNALLLALFGASWQLRRAAPEHPSRGALALSLAGLMLGNATAWLGGELVYRLGVGVDPGANLEAPASLTHP